VRRRKVFGFGLACAMVAALSVVVGTSVASATATPSSVTSAAAKAAAKPAAAETAAEAVTWGPWKHVVGGGSGSLNALGCLTATDCFAWDFNSGKPELVRWNGSTWSAPTTPKLSGPVNNGISETSCPTSTFCMSVGSAEIDGGEGSPIASAYVYSGGTWKATKPSGTSMAHVSCASPVFCVATDYADEVSEYNGKTWTTAKELSSGGYPADDNVSCVSAAFCIATTDKDAVYQWNGKSWQQTVTALTGASGPLGVSCVASTWCLAVDGAGHVYRYDGSSWTPLGGAGTTVDHGNLVCTSKTFCLIGENGGKVARFNGNAWTLSAGLFSVPGTVFSTPALSCAGQACVATAEAPDMTVARTFTDGRWNAQKIADSSITLNQVSCPTTTFCAALGAGIFAMTWQHGTWSTPVYLPSRLLPTPTGELEEDLSCTSATFCLADAIDGSVWRYNGHTWTVIASPPSASPGITGLACASSTFCIATVTPTTNSKKQPTSSGVDVFNGSRWTEVTSWTGEDTGHWQYWQYASCSTTRLCVVSDHFGHAAMFNGKSWRELKDPAMVVHGLGIFSCTAGFCAVAAAGPYENGPVASGVDIFNGKSWTYHQLASGYYGSGGVINYAACAPHGTFCVATTGHGRTYSYNGSQWSRLSVLGGLGPDISCASAKFCLAVDYTGDVAIGT